MTAGTLITHGAHSMRANQTSLLLHLFIVGDEHTTFTSRDVLVREEAECSTIANGSKLLAFVLRQRSMTSIFNHFEVMLLGYSHNLIHLSRETSHVNYHNALGLRSNLALNVSWINIDMVWAYNISKDWCSTHIADAIARGCKGQRWANHLITGAKATNHTANVKGIGAVRHRDCILYLPHVNKHLL